MFVIKKYTLCNNCNDIFLQESTHGNVHLVKLTRLLRLARLLQKMDRYSQYSALILTLLMLSFSLVAHWLACIWFIIAEKEIESHKNETWDLGVYTSTSTSSYQSKDLQTSSKLPKTIHCLNV